jgi:hypothetical protein
VTEPSNGPVVWYLAITGLSDSASPAFNFLALFFIFIYLFNFYFLLCILNLFYFRGITIFSCCFCCLFDGKY